MVVAELRGFVSESSFDFFHLLVHSIDERVELIGNGAVVLLEVVEGLLEEVEMSVQIFLEFLEKRSVRWVEEEDHKL